METATIQSSNGDAGFTPEAASALPEIAREPAVQPIVPEKMATYFVRLASKVDAHDFEIVAGLDTDGLYIGKRPIIGAEGQGELLNQAGTVFQHTVIYVKHAGKVCALDYGPRGDADVTANVMEAVPCGPVLQENAVPDPGHNLLRVKLPSANLNSPLVQKAIAFAESRKYHAINNNCIHNTDFLCRVLTHGRLRGAPLVYDALAGKVPEEDNPMLLMFFLMTRLSWFHVCDGSPLTAAFMDKNKGKETPERHSSDDSARPVANGAVPSRRPEGSQQLENQIKFANLLQALQANGTQKGVSS